MTRRRTPSMLSFFLMFLFAPEADAAIDLGTVKGIVRDTNRSAISGAEISLLDARRIVVRAVETNADGAFTLAAVPPTRYILLATAKGMAPHQQVVQVSAAGDTMADIVLQAQAFSQDMIVTAAPGVVQPETDLSQPVNMIDEDEIALRAHTVTAEIAAEEPGLHLQRTSPTIGAVFVRGFTGNKVSVFVDGVRFSTSAMRGGINTFMNLIDMSFLSGVEVLRGPNSAQYGSDAMGGSLQFFSRSPKLTDEGSAWGGTVTAGVNSADSSGGLAVSGNYATKTFGLTATVSGRKVNDVYPGDGVDSHNAVTRFLGLPSDVVIDDTLPDTSFKQGAGAFRFEWMPTPNGRMVGGYMHGVQKDGQRYDQLIGGDGNLVADLQNVNMDLAYLKYDCMAALWFDSVSVSYSWGAQREERVNQGGNGNPNASINHEPEKTTTNGVQTVLTKFAGRHAMSFGGDVYYDQVTSRSYGVNPNTGVTTTRRGRIPDGATYLHGGVFAQDVFEIVPEKLTMNGSLRWGGAKYEAHAADSPIVGGAPLWPDDELKASSFTFRVGAAWTFVPGMQLTGNVSRGFRTPHITDLGTLGLTGAGFEVSAPEIAGLGGEIGSTADANAVSIGRPVEQLEPETSLTYEIGYRVQRSRWELGTSVFLTDVDDNITKQTLILPQGAVGTVIGGETITSQNANGAVFVAAATNPVLVRANFDDARIFGVEFSSSGDLGRGLRLSAVATYLHAEDTATGLPPNIEGGTPPPEAYLTLRYTSPTRRFFVEPYLHGAMKQDRLSTLDLGDRRTGAGRSTGSIANFFNNGARARGLIGNGVDTLPNTPDDILLATGETLAQVQLRVLGPSLAASSLYTEIPSYTTVGVRGGINFGMHSVILDAQNLTDENYRGPSWGMDAPGRGVFVGYKFSY